MYRRTNITNPECEHLGVRDEGYGPYERHDDYCWLHLIWCPSCAGCADATRHEELETEDCDDEA